MPNRILNGYRFQLRCKKKLARMKMGNTNCETSEAPFAVLLNMDI